MSSERRLKSERTVDKTLDAHSDYILQLLKKVERLEERVEDIAQDPRQFMGQKWARPSYPMSV